MLLNAVREVLGDRLRKGMEKSAAFPVFKKRHSLPLPTLSSQEVGL